MLPIAYEGAVLNPDVAVVRADTMIHHKHRRTPVEIEYVMLKYNVIVATLEVDPLTVGRRGNVPELCCPPSGA